MEYILLILLIMNTTIAYASIFKRKFEETITFTIVSYTVILFLTGVIGLLNVGFYLIIVVNILLLLYNIYAIIKKKISLKNQIFTLGFILFIITYIFILWISIGRKSIEWDEFSHWSLAVKNMFNLGNLGLGEESTILCKNYLSGTSIFQFFCTKLSGEFKEGMLYVGMNLMISATIVPVFKNIKSRKSLIAYIGYGIMFFVPMYFYPLIYKTVYVDGILALVFAYTLYSYFSDEEKGLTKFKAINLMVNLTWLVLIKDFGLVFAVGTLFIILINNLFIDNKFKLKSLWKNSKYLILTAVPMILVKVIWAITLKVNNVVTASDTSNLLPYQSETVRIYLDALFVTPLTVVYSFTFAMCICLAIILAYIVRKNSSDKKSIQVVLTLLIIGAGAYAILLMFVPYLSMFSEYEALKLASYSRYMNEYILGLIFAELALIARELSDNKEKFERFILIFFAIFIFTFPFAYIEQFTINARYSVNSTIQDRSRFETFNNLISKNVQKNEKVFFIATNTDGGDYYVAKYEATPVKLSTSWSISDKPYNEGDIWTEIKTKGQWKQELIEGYDYVYLYTIDEVFIENYGQLFVNNIETIQNDQLYKINKTENLDQILELVQE